jgi:filamentous hemagglutinin
LAGAAFLKLGLLSLALTMVLASSASACYFCNLIEVSWYPFHAWACDFVSGPQQGNVGCVSENSGSWCNAYGDPCYGGGPGCFLAGTMVSTPDGDRPIESLQAGDAIWCVGEDGRRVAGEITATLRAVSHGYYRLNGSTLVTGAHRFLAKQSGQNFGITLASTEFDRHGKYEQHALGEWIPLEDLALGQQLRTIDGDLVTVETVEFVDRGVRVFNLEVAPYHNYFANGILVHNKKPDPHQP